MTLKILTSKGQIRLYKKVDDMFGLLYLTNRKAVSIEAMNAAVQTKAKQKRLD